jgi:hypothetical protein
MCTDSNRIPERKIQPGRTACTWEDSEMDLREVVRVSI